MADRLTAYEKTAQLTAVPSDASDAHNERDFGVIDGGFGLAARIIRFMGTTLLVTFIVGLVGALVLHATIIENQRELDAQRTEIARLATETESMRSELAELEAPARIVSEAEDLGMIEAPSIAYITAPGSELDDRTLTIASNQLRVNSAGIAE